MYNYNIKLFFFLISDDARWMIVLNMTIHSPCVSYQLADMLRKVSALSKQ